VQHLDKAASISGSDAALRSTRTLGARNHQRGYTRAMSPTIFRDGGFRFYFFSREEPRMHVHVQHTDGEAKYWLEPALELAQNYRLTEQQLRRAKSLIEEHIDELRRAWKKHFEG
jgi:hypothetical protein